VLRNASSAELAINIQIGDPVAAGSRESGVPPMSRISQHDVTTNVYVDSLDLFDLSTFANQATVNGGRGYVPLIGPVWQNLFEDLPVIGHLFSWKKPPATRYHQSLVVVNSAITPTAMGIALLYPTRSTQLSFNEQVRKISEYTFKLKQQAYPSSALPSDQTVDQVVQKRLAAEQE
jgi:hypothetical protein